ncbi:class I SAM-dependent methyltransferase [Candidatus Microgenomates bacterium]|nr:class I SAM-dependent methyltransferase [Candidatus Microgenomates bacterium]
MIDKLAETIKLPKHSYLLDAGCGEGYTAIYLAQHYHYHVAGVDLLDFNITSAKKKSQKEGVKEKVNFHIMNYEHLTYSDSTFDGVYTLETLVHAQNYIKALREFHRILKPHGKIVLFEYTMAPQKLLTKQQKEMATLVNKVSGMHSFSHFIHGSFPNIMKEAGFTTVSVTDITQEVLPGLKFFYYLAFLVYPIIKLLKLQKIFINATCAVEAYKNVKDDIFRYVIVEAVKS